MPWIISFILSWILFLLLIDWSKLKTNMFSGIMAALLALLVDAGSQRLELYKFYATIIPLWMCSIFYKFGPVFTIGTLFAQYLPKRRGLQTLNIMVLSLLFLSYEYLMLQVGAAKYFHWHILASLTTDMLIFSSLTWFTMTFLKE